MLNNLIDYSERIDNWIKLAKTEEEHMNLKEMSRLSGKKIKKQIHVRKNDAGLFIISQSNRIWDISLYYNDPERYYYDTYILMKSIGNEIHNEYTNGSYIQYRYPAKSKIEEMSVIHYVFNMIIWLPFFILNIPITKELTFMDKVFNNKTYVEFINKKIIEPYKHLVTHNEMSRILAKMYDMFIFMCERYGLDLGLSFSVYDFIIKWNDNKELYDLNHTKIPKNMQIAESENYLNERLYRTLEIYENDPEDNVLKPFIRSKEGISNKQLREFAISGGFKPDLSGNTYPIYPRSNLLTEGYRNPTDYVIDAVGGRKAGVLALQIDASGLIKNVRLHCEM